MPGEFEELRLQVTLQDDASTGSGAYLSTRLVRTSCVESAALRNHALSSRLTSLKKRAEVKRERDEFRAALAELRAAVTARWEAEARLAELYRERAIARATAVERDPNAMLN